MSDNSGSLKYFLDNLTNEDLLQRLDLALEGANLGIWDWDLRDNSVQFDRRWCQMLGLDHNETSMELKTWESRVHPEDLPKCYEDIKAYLDGKTEYYENIHRMKHTNGEWVYILDRGRLSGWDGKGKPIRFTGTHFDVTSSEKAKRMIQNDQQRLEKMIENLPASVCMLDENYCYLAATSSWKSNFRLDANFIGQSHFEKVPHFADYWRKIFAKVLKGEILKKDRDLVKSTNESEAQWLRWEARPWRDTSGDIRGILFRLTNITSEIELEAKMNHSSKMAALGEMAGGVAHEINNPLGVISSAAHLLGELCAQTNLDREKVFYAIDTIERTAERISKIVHGLRNISRDSSNIEPETCLLKNVVEDALNLCSQQMRKREIDVRVNLQNFADSKIICRPVEISQILVNLLHNSKDAIEKSSNKWIAIDVVEDSDSYDIFVTDSGDKIGDSVAQKMMTPFFTTKDFGKGTGLGLSVSKGLAEHNGGQLEYCPEAENTRFRLKVRKYIEPSQKFKGA